MCWRGGRIAKVLISKFELQVTGVYLSEDFLRDTLDVPVANIGLVVRRFAVDRAVLWTGSGCIRH